MEKYAIMKCTIKLKGEYIMKRKITIGIAAAAVMIMMTYSPVLADWEQTNGTWNFKEDGQNVANTWKQIDGKWYYFNETGEMQSGWLQKDGKWYYLDSKNGDMKEGWVQDGDKWYFLDNTTGEMATGWKKTGDKWYFLDNSGSMQTGIVEVNGKIYALDEKNGNMQTGAVLWSDKMVYTFDPVTGEAVGDRIPIPTKAYGSDGKKQENISVAVQQQIQQMQEKQKEESRSSSPSSGSSSSKPSKPNKPSKPSDKPNNGDSSDNTVTEVKIEEITIPKSGMVDVVLSQAVELKSSNFYISCPGGNDMTIIKVETEEGSQKNKVYHITTTYYNDNTYNMEITLPNGKKIEKTFVTNMSAPELKDIDAKRVDKNTADISLISDDAGILYYMAVPTSMSRQAIGEQVPQTGQEIKEKGASMQLNQEGMHNLTIKDLKENQAYTVYFATAQKDGDTAVLRGSVVVSAEPVDQNTGEMQIEEAYAPSDSEIKFVLSKPTQEALTLANVDVECANGEIRIGRMQTEDNKTYTIYMQDYWFMNSKTGYTVYITLPDGSKLEKKFYTDFDYPNLNEKKIRKIAEDEIEVEFRSNEGGVFYCGTAASEDEVPTADEIVETHEKRTLNGGSNKFTMKIDKNDTVFYIIPIDQTGNRPPTFAEKTPIPEKIEEGTGSGSETEDTTSISDIKLSKNSNGYHKLTVTFKEAIDIVFDVEKEDIKIYALEGEGFMTEPKIVERGGSFDGLNIFYLQYNIIFPEGRYRLEFKMNGVYYSKEFEVQ